MSQTFVEKTGGRVGVLAVLLFLGGCGRQPGTEETETLPLAQVADYTITIQELVSYERELPERLQSSATGVHAHREHLQGLARSPPI